MKSLLNILIYAIRAKFMRVWIKVRMWSKPAFIRTRVLSRVRQFFVKILDVRPKHERDYYGVFHWLVSKQLAFALVVIFALLAIVYINSVLPKDFFSSNKSGNSDNSVPAYSYRSIPLKFYSGAVKILNRDGDVTYEGEVDEGKASGSGILYTDDGNILYNGQFANNMYNGTGTLYYSGGVICYKGSFTDNLFNGVGSYYRPNGTLEYTGDYVMGLRTGNGKLHDSVGTQIFEGGFLKNEVVYADFLDRPTTEISGLYNGKSEFYQSATEYCVTMPEINALYAVRDGRNTLESEWTVDRICVMKNSISLSGGVCETIGQLQKELGEPLYFGTTWVNLPEAVAWNSLAKEQPEAIIPVDIRTQTSIADVYSVSSYNQNYKIYIYTFEKEGLLYTFYQTGAGESEFVMYAIEKA